MSERISNERAIEILEKIKSKSEEYIKNSQTRINTTDFTPLKNAFVRKQEYANKKVQALDIAIDSLEREEIKDPEDLYLGIDIAIKILEKQRDKVEPYERKEQV